MMATIAHPVNFAAVIQRTVAANQEFIFGDQATAKKLPRRKTWLFLQCGTENLVFIALAT